MYLVSGGRAFQHRAAVYRTVDRTKDVPAGSRMNPCLRALLDRTKPTSSNLVGRQW